MSLETFAAPIPSRILADCLGHQSKLRIEPLKPAKKNFDFIEAVDE
jgi:hypothetical protein